MVELQLGRMKETNLFELDTVLIMGFVILRQAFDSTFQFIGFLMMFFFLGRGVLFLQCLFDSKVWIFLLVMVMGHRSFVCSSSFPCFIQINIFEVLSFGLKMFTVSLI